MLKAEEDTDLESYFKSILERKSDPDTTKVISFVAMGIALAVFIVLISC